MTAPPVVTGIAAVAPNGLGTEAFWDATCRGTSGIGQVARFDPTSYPARVAGEVTGFDAEEHLPSRLVPQTDRMTQLALSATDWALADAGARPVEFPEFDMGVVTASTCGGFEFGEKELQKLWRLGGEHVSAYQSFAWFYAVNTGQISIRNGMRGPSGVVVSEQSGGLDALAQARRYIRSGSGLIASGGVDASVCPWGWVAHLASGRLSTAASPHDAYLPFDGRAHGHVPGEGGAILIVEEADQAIRRRAPRYGEVAGYAAGFDPTRASGRQPVLERVIRQALDDAAVSPADIDVVFADGAALPELDEIEAHAVTTVFGPFGVPVTAPKTMTGRLGAGGAPLDVAAALLAIRDRVIPPTINISRAAQYELDIVTDEYRRATVGAALVLARGYGGFSSALVIRAPR